MCGIVGIYSLDGKSEGLLDEAMDLLRGNKNRGQDGYGLSILSQSGKLETFKFEDLDVDTQKIVEEVNDEIVAIIGHARYSTSGGGENTHEYLQPFEVNHLKNGMAFAFNGNIVNAPELAKELKKSDGIKIHKPLLDTNVLKHMILSRVKSGETDLKKILEYINNKIDGACNIVLLSKDGNMVFSKDRWGFRPLAWSIKDSKVYLSSESAALFKVGCNDINFLKTGRYVEVNNNNKKIKEKKMDLEEEIKKSSCFFESVYFADPRTQIGKHPSNLLRYSLGQQLAKEEVESFNREDTLVIDVPKSSVDCAEGYSEVMNLEHYTGAITKNTKIDRTFISEGASREEKVKKKYIFNPNLKDDIKGKKVIIIDDSIVRGTTMRILVKLFTDFYEPSEVHLRIPSPPITHPCFYAMNIPTTKELISRHYFKDTNNPTPEELDNLAKYFNVESLKYISVEGLIEGLRVKISKTCLACVNGEYKTACGQKKYEKMVKKR